MVSSLTIAYQLLITPLLSLLLAFWFGNDGYESFLALIIALGVLYTAQILALIRQIFRAKLLTALKPLFGLLLLIFWFCAMLFVVLVVVSSDGEPEQLIPPAHWWTVVGIVLIYLLGFRPRVLAKSKSQQAINVFVTFYSVIILFIASVSFYSHGIERHNTRDIVLVLAGQLQYILTYVVINLNYMKRVIPFGQKLIHRLHIRNADKQNNLLIVLSVLPFFVPLLIILIATLA